MKYIPRKVVYGIPVILSVIGCLVASFYKPLLIVSTDDTFHFSLITVNSLFGGFLYTNYSLLLGLMDNTIIEEVKDTRILEKRNRHISCGILYATVSVISGIYVVLFSCGKILLTKLFYLFAVNAEIVFMFFAITFFVLSLREMNQLVNAANTTHNKKTKEEIDSLKRKIRSAAGSQDK